MNEDIRAFLSRFTIEELQAQHVLEMDSRWATLLRAGSVSPLIELMGKHNVTKLEAVDRAWSTVGQLTPLVHQAAVGVLVEDAGH